jgi:hypothetical protein
MIVLITVSQTESESYEGKVRDRRERGREGGREGEGGGNHFGYVETKTHITW